MNNDACHRLPVSPRLLVDGIEVRRGLPDWWLRCRVRRWENAASKLVSPEAPEQALSLPELATEDEAAVEQLMKALEDSGILHRAERFTTERSIAMAGPAWSKGLARDAAEDDFAPAAQNPLIGR